MQNTKIDLNFTKNYKCCKCKEWQPKTEYYKDSGRSTGIQSKCKKCSNNRSRRNSDGSLRPSRCYKNYSPSQKIMHNLRRRTREVLKEKKDLFSVTENLGCSKFDLIKHLEAQFEPGMSWQNYGNGVGKWNIDHITPLSSFDLTDMEEFKKAAHFSNLRPMWAIDNILKSNKLNF